MRGVRDLGRALRVLVAVWVGAFALTVLLLGGWKPLYLLAAAPLAVVAAVAAAVTDACARLGYRLRWGWLRVALSVPHRTVVDFAILTRELVRAALRRRIPRGEFRTKPSGDAGSAPRRAFIGAVGGYSPNSYVVGFDDTRGEVLVHDLIPDARSEAPA